ncbi:hypothetical protein CYG49_01395 [Candidatus Saccharibacteria bacterium]|nr:MAG: hypothetical protein CYG49_01395 [Candidatus Saccharibacteria bacterium]
MNEQNSTTSQATTKAPRRRGLLATVLGANIGFIAGSALGFFYATKTFETDPSYGIGNVAFILLYIAIALLFGALAGLLGAFLALTARGYEKRGKTLLLMVILYPLSLTFLGADFLVSALFVPVIARFIALKW